MITILMNRQRTMILTEDDDIDIDESKRRNSGTVFFPFHQWDKSRYSGTVLAIPGQLATMDCWGGSQEHGLSGSLPSLTLFLLSWHIFAN